MSLIHCYGDFVLFFFSVLLFCLSHRTLFQLFTFCMPLFLAICRFGSFVNWPTFVFILSCYLRSFRFPARGRSVGKFHFLPLCTSSFFILLFVFMSVLGVYFRVTTVQCYIMKTVVFPSRLYAHYYSIAGLYVLDINTVRYLYPNCPPPPPPG